MKQEKKWKVSKLEEEKQSLFLEDIILYTYI